MLFYQRMYVLYTHFELLSTNIVVVYKQHYQSLATTCVAMYVL